MLVHNHPHSHGSNRIDNHRAASGETFGKDHAHKHNTREEGEAVPDKIPPDFEHSHNHAHTDVEEVTDADTNLPVHRVLSGNVSDTSASKPQFMQERTTKAPRPEG